MAYEAPTTAWTRVGLDIKSSTAGQSGSQSTGYGLARSGSADFVGEDTKPEEEGIQGDTWSVSGGGNRSRGRSGAPPATW